MERTVVAWAVGAISLLGAWWASRRRMRVADTPRSRCAAVFVGFNRVQGTVLGVSPTAAQFSGKVAAWWRATVEHEWEVTSELVHHDWNGDERRELRVRYEFHLVSWWNSQARFDIIDDTGAVRVDPGTARVDAPLCYSETIGTRRDGIGKPSGPGQRPTGVIRRREYRLHDGDRIYCMGCARVDNSGTSLIIDGKGNDEFLITVVPPATVARRRRTGAWALGSIGAAVPLVTAGTMAWAAARGVIVGAVLTVWNIGMLWNRLVRVKQTQQRAWSLIDVELDRRAVLTPYLVEVAAAAARHESDVLTSIITIRGSGAAPWEVLLERQPRLRADAVVRSTFDELRATEGRIAAAREYFNDAVTALRNRTQSFPGLLLVPFARAGRFGSMDLIEAGDEERRAPELRRLLNLGPSS